MARVLVLAFFILVGMGIYVFTVKTDLEAAQAQVTNITQDRDQWKTRLTQFQSQGKETQAKLDQCTSEKNDVQAQLEAAQASMKKPAGKK